MRTCIRHSDPNWITPRSVYRGKRNGPHQGARTPSVQPPHCGRNSHTTPLAQHSVLIPTLLSGGLASSRASSRGRTHRSGLPVSAAQGLDKRKQAADWREQTKCQTKQVREAKPRMRTHLSTSHCRSLPTPQASPHRCCTWARVGRSLTHGHAEK